jgi:FAD:protein FMN transferase
MATDGQVSWQALGSTVVLKLTEPLLLPQARAIVEAELAAVDEACSRFRPDSELSRLNAAAGRAVAVGPLLAQALEVALRAAEITNGDVDPSIGVALQLAGYDRDFALLEQVPTRPGGEPRRTPHVRVLRRAGWRAIELDRTARVVRMPASVQLDLGATAKAWAADRAATAVAEATGVGALVALGGDIATAGPAPSCGWQVHVTDDHRSTPSASGQTIAIRSGGLATSSTTVRQWNKDGERMHHIIDPQTGRPAQSAWRTVSVAAAHCADANIAATAAILRSQRALPWLEALRLPARLIAHDGTAVLVGGWPEPRAKESFAA